MDSYPCVQDVPIGFGPVWTGWAGRSVGLVRTWYSDLRLMGYVIILSINVTANGRTDIMFFQYLDQFLSLSITRHTKYRISVPICDTNRRWSFIDEYSLRYIEMSTVPKLSSCPETPLPMGALPSCFFNILINFCH